MQSPDQPVMSPEIQAKIESSGFAAVLVIDDVKHAIPVARALIAGGVYAIELTLRTPAALDSIRAIKKEVPEMLLGIGTVINCEQVDLMVDIGVDFAVSPGCNPRIISYAKKQGLPFAPGVMTPTDIEIAVELGCRILKYFPAKTSGGIAHLKSMVAPYQYLGLKFIPLGGVSMNNASEYLESPLVAAIGGSWVAKRTLIQNERWDAITENSLGISSLIKKIRSEQ